jgi:hypothetical protein
MAIIKRVQTFGRVHGLLLNHDFLEYLGFNLDDMEGAELSVEKVDGMLVLCRGSALTVDPGRQRKVLEELARRRNESVRLKDGVSLNLTNYRLALCNLLWREGPLRPKTLIEKMNVKENAGYNRIKRVTEEGLIIKGTTTYSLNPEYFDV